MARSPDNSIPTRQTLLERLKDWQDHESWQEFFDTYWKLIFAMATRAGLTEAEAQDVVQETVISVAKNIGKYKADPMFGSFKSWLLLITRRRIADQFRKRARFIEPHRPNSGDKTRTPTIQRIADPASLDWEEAWNEKWRENLMDVAMQRVKEQASPKEYLLFHQLVVKEWPAGKVAKKHKVSRASVYMAKYRISKLIKEEVRRLEKRSEK